MKRIPENVRTTLIMFLIGIVLVCVCYLPGRIKERENMRFAQPLFEHTVPDRTYRVQNSTARDENGGTTAAVLLGSDGIEEDELLAHYRDTAYPPAHAGEQVSLQVKALDEASVSALKSAGKYREGDSYYFVYIYSTP